MEAASLPTLSAFLAWVEVVEPAAYWKRTRKITFQEELKAHGLIGTIAAVKAPSSPKSASAFIPIPTLWTPVVAPVET